MESRLIIRRGQRCPVPWFRRPRRPQPSAEPHRGGEDGSGADRCHHPGTRPPPADLVSSDEAGFRPKPLDSAWSLRRASLRVTYSISSGTWRSIRWSRGALASCRCSSTTRKHSPSSLRHCPARSRHKVSQAASPRDLRLRAGASSAVATTHILPRKGWTANTSIHNPAMT